jgi:hypothetical protein
MCSGRVNSSCSSSDTCRVTVKRHEQMRKCYHAIVYVADKGRHIITMLLLQWKEYLPDIYKYVYYIMMIVLLIKKQRILKVICIC